MFFSRRIIIVFIDRKHYILNNYQVDPRFIDDIFLFQNFHNPLKKWFSLEFFVDIKNYNQREQLVDFI